MGKTALIRKVLEGQPALFFEGLENQTTSEQIANFCLQLAQQTGRAPGSDRPKRWREALLLLEPVLRKRPACIVFDEFQWMANYRSAIVSDLRMVWDQYLSHIGGVSLIMCGSIASFMVRKVIRGTAFYGRVRLQIHLMPFQLVETQHMLSGQGFSEVLQAYLMVGGVPLYLELLADAPSVALVVR